MNSVFELLRLYSRAWFLRNIVLSVGGVVFSDPTFKRLKYLERAQWLDREQLHSERDRLLQSLVLICYEEVPFYRDLFDHSRVRPEDIRRARDLHSLPIVTKSMLRSRYPNGTVRPTGTSTYEAVTSGSTGSNFRVLHDQDTAAYYRAAFLLALQWAGWTIGESHLQTGMTVKRSLEKRFKDFFLGCHYIPANDLRDARLDQNLELIERHKIQHIWGYPSSLYYLAQRALRKGWNKKLRTIVTWGDNLYPPHRATIQRAFGQRVFDNYGCSEGMQVSAQCGHGNTYHIHGLDVIVETVDEHGQPVPDGQPGAVVVTRLYPGPMPLLRYRVGDIATTNRARKCSCGHEYDVMESIQGRDTDVVITPDGNRLIVHFFTGILEHFREIESFQVIQESIELMLVRLVPTKQFSRDSIKRIVAALQAKGASGIRIEIEVVDQIPLTRGGKRRFIVSNLVNAPDRCDS